MRVNGPYVHKTGKLAGRKYVNIITDDGKKTSKLYSRYLVERNLGRTLTFDETVDHINEDPTDDRLINLQIITRSDNAKKSAKERRFIEWITFRCPMCGGWFKKEARLVRHNRRKGHTGPYCGRSCAGRASHL